MNSKFCFKLWEGKQSHKHKQCLKGAVSHTYVFGLKYTEGYMRFMKMLQGLSSC
jgi:hypothetical protein